MGQTLTDYFWMLHKNKNCAFPLKRLSTVHVVLYSYKAKKEQTWIEKTAFDDNNSV